LLKFNDEGLIPAIVQDYNTAAVLMMAYMNQEALEKTIETKEAWFWSRSRGELWHKGETSGNYLQVERVLVDCDNDTLLLQVIPAGPACHTGETSCFSHQLIVSEWGVGVEEESTRTGPPATIVGELFSVIKDRQEKKPAGSYVSHLFDLGPDEIAKKIGEEAAEVIIAAKNQNGAELVTETADLWFHSLIMLAAGEVAPNEVWKELENRRR